MDSMLASATPSALAEGPFSVHTVAVLDQNNTIILPSGGNCHQKNNHRVSYPDVNMIDAFIVYF